MELSSFTPSTISFNDIRYLRDNENSGDVSYFGELYPTSSGMNMNIEDVLKTPVSYILSKDIFTVLTTVKFYDDVFKNIRPEKSGSSSLLFSSTALAVNDFLASELLSAIGPDGDSNAYVIGYSEGSTIEDDRDITNYSFNTTLRNNFTNTHLFVNNGTLSSTIDADDLTDDFYFYVRLIDQTYCNIIKTGEDGDKYITYDVGSDTLTSNTDEDIIFSRFIYSYNSITNALLLVVPEYGTIGINSSGDIAITPLDSATLSSEINQNIFTVDGKNSLDKLEAIYNSFSPVYSDSNNIVDQYFTFSNNLYTHNYESDLDKNSNFIALKNNLTPAGEYSLVNQESNTTHRQYTSLTAGIRGDSSYNNYILNYTSDVFDVVFTPDKQTYFNIPYEFRGYTQININDTSLIKNGAIGGNSPLNSDKVYKKLYEYADFKNTGVTANVDNGQYLCTWLWYNPLRPSQSMWLDRYYNPDKVTNTSALSVDGWNTISHLESFSTTSMLEGVYAEYFTEFDKGIGVFDVESKLTFQPNSLFMYERIGKKVSQSLHDQKRDLLLVTQTELTMDFTQSNILITENTTNDEEFSINLVLENFNLESFRGNKIFGNNTVSLTVDRNFTPFTTSLSGSEMFFYDHDYNEVTSVNISSDINTDNVIFTDDYNLIYVEDVDGIVHTIENLDFITNSTSALTSLDIADIKYYDSKLSILLSSGGYFEFDPNTEKLAAKGNGISGDDLLLVYDDVYSSYVGKYVDYSETGVPYVLNDNAVYYNNITTAAISGDSIIDIATDVNNIIYALKDDGLYTIDNTFIPKVIKSVNINPTNTNNLKYINRGRYIRNGVITEYLDVVETDNLSSTIIHRYDRELNLIKKIDDKSISGTPIKGSNIYNTKFLSKQLDLDITLFGIFDFNKTGKVRLTVDEKYINEDSTCILNVIFSNKYGTITLYCNGNIVAIEKFDKNIYYFSNTLRDTKLFIGASNYNGESTINDMLLSSNNDMTSGGFTIKELTIYDTYFNFFDVSNFNRIYRAPKGNNLLLPIQHRSYIEEVSGFFIQNKNMRKSEYGSINIRGTDLTDDMKADVTKRINQTVEDTYINLRINNINIE